MKTRVKADATELVEWLFDDLNDRSGFDTGHIDDETLTEWKDKWAERIEKMLGKYATEGT